MEWARLSPTMTTSYLASLLEAWNLNLSAYSTSIPFGEVRINPAPLPWVLAAPSTDDLQMGRSDTSSVVSVGSVEVNSMMKYAKTCPLTVFLGLYLILNSLNSMAYFTSLLKVSGLCNIFFIGCYVGISMVWAWKYGRSLLAVVTNARTSFSIFRYLSSAPLKAQLQ